MLELATLIDDSRVILNVQADCPKAVFRVASEALSERSGVAARDIAGALVERERIGSTAIGEGVAVPHARLEALSEPQAMFMRLSQPIDMDAADDALVDIFFVLLVPQEADNDHLRVLSRVARIIRQSEMLEQFRHASRASDVTALFK